MASVGKNSRSSVLDDMRPPPSPPPSLPAPGPCMCIAGPILVCLPWRPDRALGALLIRPWLVAVCGAGRGSVMCPTQSIARGLEGRKKRSTTWMEVDLMSDLGESAMIDEVHAIRSQNQPQPTATHSNLDCD